MLKGFFSIIQYSPDPAHSEAINIGILLTVPELNYLDVKITTNYTRIKNVLVGKQHLDFLKTTLQTFEQTITSLKNKLLATSELDKFIKTRAHEVRLTSLRDIKVHDPAGTLNKLFEQLVPVIEQKKQEVETIPFPLIDSILRSPKFSMIMKYDVTVTLPLSGRKFNAPYSYVNGRTNLIKPQTIKSFDSAEKLAAEGEIIKHKLDSQLIVIPRITMPEPDAVKNICEFFSIMNVPCYTEDTIDALYEKIEHEAHEV